MQLKLLCALFIVDMCQQVSGHQYNQSTELH